MDEKYKDILNKGQAHLRKATEKAKLLAGTVISHPKAQTAIKTTKEFCDEKGITETSVKVGNKINDGKRTFTGEKALEELTQTINMQNCYNDLLATKLEEALKRIELLEQRLDKIGQFHED